MITEERLQKAISYLAETDVPAAEAKTNVERQAWKQKQTEAAIYLRSEGTVENRKAYARTSKELTQAVDDWLEALEHSEAIINKRKTEALVVELWRTEQANRRAGNVT